MFFGLGSNISGIFSKIFLIGWPNCRWKSPGELFENNVFFEKNLFQTLRQKRSEKGKILRLPSLNCIKRDHKNILRIFFLRFGDLFSHSRTFSRNKRLSELLSMGPEDSFEKRKIFKIRVFFQQILDLDLFLKACGQKNSCDVSKLHSMCPKNCFFKEEQVLEKLIAFFSNSDLELKRF